jgi:hypothetical protein
VSFVKVLFQGTFDIERFATVLAGMILIRNNMFLEMVNPGISKVAKDSQT